jgi:hypothetical protein
MSEMTPAEVVAIAVFKLRIMLDEKDARIAELEALLSHSSARSGAKAVVGPTSAQAMSSGVKAAPEAETRAGETRTDERECLG